MPETPLKTYTVQYVGPHTGWVATLCFDVDSRACFDLDPPFGLMTEAEAMELAARFQAETDDDLRPRDTDDQADSPGVWA